MAKTLYRTNSDRLNIMRRSQYRKEDLIEEIEVEVVTDSLFKVKTSSPWVRRYDGSNKFWSSKEKAIQYLILKQSEIITSNEKTINNFRKNIDFRKLIIQDLQDL